MFFDDSLDSRFLIAMAGSEPDMIIIITDGFSSFPDERYRRNIPTLWLINNKTVTHPWGMIARF